MQEGQRVITEMRLFPDEGDGSPLGEWSHSQPAPAGGINHAVVQKLQINALAELLRDRSEQAEAIVSELDEEAEALAESAAGPPPGRAGRPDLYSARLARLYTQFADPRPDGTRANAPLANLAEAGGTSTNTMARRIKEARARGLLTSPKRGQVGGDLTDKARALLAEEGDSP
jgi:hypothetical protein